MGGVCVYFWFGFTNNGAAGWLAGFDVRGWEKKRIGGKERVTQVNGKYGEGVVM